MDDKEKLPDRCPICKKVSNKPKMAYSRDAFIRELLKGLEREIGETGGILEIDWREAYHRLICNCI